MSTFCALALLCCLPFRLIAQVSSQARLLVHPTIALSEGVYLTMWAIGNIRQNQPDNFSLFPGVGWRSGNFWGEAMVQRQWSRAGNKWNLNFRSGGRRARFSWYAEFSPFLTDKGSAHSVWVEQSLSTRVALGLETENVYLSGREPSLGAGPRVSFVVAPNARRRFVATVVYQLRRGEPNIARVYLAFHPRF